MRNTQHTPGPWIIDPDDHTIITNIEMHSVGETICKAETKADAALIAATIDLLEALQDARNVMLDRGIPVDPEHPHRLALNKVESAITRATGGAV